jgi:4,5-DOPA dioxygenase extradiol
MAEKMPVLFIGHGSPMNIILDNSYTRSLAALGKSLPRPKAILVISAHWLTNGTYVTCANRPKTIHDFYGFPEELYAMRYPSPGAPDEARHVTELVRAADVACSLDWADHVVGRASTSPQSRYPVFEMSLDYTFNEWHPKPLRYHYELAAELADPRRRAC